MIPRRPGVWGFLARNWLAIVVLLLIAGVAGGADRVEASKLHGNWLIGARTVTWLAFVSFVLLVRPYRRWIWFLSIHQWKQIDAETDRAPVAPGTFDLTILVVLVTVAVSLTLQEYIGDRGFFEMHWPPTPGNKYFELEAFAWWSGWRVLGYVIMPCVVMLLAPPLRRAFGIKSPFPLRIRDCHVSLRGFFSHLWIYVVLFALVSPAVIAASKTDAFRHTYPFYRMANRSTFDLWAWEGLYAAQFVSLEFFFRGFILSGLRRALGSNAIFVMIVPYCMIHYGKPLPETLGAIGAGLILGTLAMRTKSIWGGVMIHIGVAMTMDVLALHGCPPIGSGHYCGD